MMIDWGVQLMNFGTDVKRVAYVLKPGELAPPKSIQAAFDKAIAVRDVLKKAIKPGVRADETMKAMDAALRAAGYGVIEFNRPNTDDKTDVVYGFHPVGNTGHDIGPSLTTWQPLQTTFELHRAAHVLVRILRLHADRRVGRQEAAHPDRRRCDPDGSTGSSSSIRPITGCSW